MFIRFLKQCNVIKHRVIKGRHGGLPLQDVMKYFWNWVRGISQSCTLHVIKQKAIPPKCRGDGDPSVRWNDAEYLVFLIHRNLHWFCSGFNFRVVIFIDLGRRGLSPNRVFCFQLITEFQGFILLNLSQVNNDLPGSH